VIIAGVVGFFAELFFRTFTNFGYGWGGGSWSSSRSSSSSSSDSDRKGSGGGGGAVVVILIAVALIALAWALSQLVRLALSRSREFLADAGSVELTKNPDAMISALRKIENRGELPGATSAVMELCLDNPREGFSDLFATHPSVQARVEALVKYAGGRDPGPLALPPLVDHRLDHQPQEPVAGESPPSLPHGPWGDAAEHPGGATNTAPQGAAQGASQGPWVNPAGPWGRH
jgi:heat shock protein HtpX